MLSTPESRAIHRVWHGWTSLANADAYQELLDTSIVPAIAERTIPGHRATRILRRDPADGVGDEVEFITIMEFDHWDAVREFAGSSGHASVVPAAAQRLLAHYDDHSHHYELVATHPDRS